MQANEWGFCIRLRRGQFQSIKPKPTDLVEAVSNFRYEPESRLAGAGTCPELARIWK
jgi:hypothetical protein